MEMMTKKQLNKIKELILILGPRVARIEITEGKVVIHTNSYGFYPRYPYYSATSTTTTGGSWTANVLPDSGILGKSKIEVDTAGKTKPPFNA